MDLNDPEFYDSSPNDLTANVAQRFVIERIPLSRRGTFLWCPKEWVSEKLTKWRSKECAPRTFLWCSATQFKDAIAPQNVPPCFDSGDPVLATAFVRLDLVNRAHVDPDVIDNVIPSFLKTLRRSFVGLFRGARLGHFLDGLVKFPVLRAG